MRYPVLAVLTVFAAACSDGASTASSTATGAATSTASMLAPLGQTEGQGLDGELGCSFSIGSETYMIAMGYVASAQRSEAAVKLDGAVAKLTATAEGGFDTLGGGGSFAADGLTVTVATASELPTGDRKSVV